MTGKEENPNYNLSYIRKLSEDDSFVVMLIELLLSSSEENLDNFKKHHQRNDLHGMGSVAHKMRSSIQHFKMVRLEAMLKEIETRCMKNEPGDDFEKLIKEMMVFYSLVMKEIEAECVTLANSAGKRSTS